MYSAKEQTGRQTDRQAGRQAETEFMHPDNKIELTALGRTNMFAVFSHYTFEKSPLNGYDSLRTYAVSSVAILHKWLITTLKKFPLIAS